TSAPGRPTLPRSAARWPAASGRATAPEPATCYHRIGRRGLHSRGLPRRDDVRVPRDRLPQALVEGEQWSPAEPLVGLGSRQALVADFVTRLVAHVRGQPRTREVQQLLGE